MYNNNQTRADDKEWDFNEAVGMAYLVHTICGARKTSQFVKQKNVTDFDVHNLGREIWQDNLIFDTLNGTEMKDKIIPFIKRVKKQLYENF
jgi:hypothetical protein